MLLSPRLSSLSLLRASYLLPWTVNVLLYIGIIKSVHRWEGDYSRYFLSYPGEGGMDNLILKPEQIFSFWMMSKIQIQIGLFGLPLLACKTPNSKLNGTLSVLYRSSKLILPQGPAFCPYCVTESLCSNNCLPWSRRVVTIHYEGRWIRN